VNPAARRPAGVLGLLGVALLVGLAAAVVMTVRIIELDEAASERAQALVLLSGLAGFAATATVGLPALWFTQGWRGRTRGLVAGPLVAAAFVAAMPFLFAVNMRVLEGHTDSDIGSEGWFREIVWSHVGAMGLFTPTGRKYLLPWPLLAIGVAGGLCFAVWPGQRGPR
jgi:hypothetical protein